MESHTSCKIKAASTVMFVAFVGGIVGGYVRDTFKRTVAAQATPTTIRATAIELIDKAGNVIGFLGSDEKRNTRLTFYDEAGKARVELRLGGRTDPWFDLNDSKGQSLISLGFPEGRRPRFVMSDPDFNGRLLLGASGWDTEETDSKFWVLRFRGNNGQALATIGMQSDGDGGLIIRDRTRKEWRLPPN